MTRRNLISLALGSLAIIPLKGLTNIPKSTPLIFSTITPRGDEVFIWWDARGIARIA